MTAPSMGSMVSGSDAPPHLRPFLDCVHEAQLTRRGGTATADQPVNITWEEWGLFRSGRRVGVVTITELELPYAA